MTDACCEFAFSKFLWKVHIMALMMLVSHFLRSDWNTTGHVRGSLCRGEGFIFEPLFQDGWMTRNDDIMSSRYLLFPCHSWSLTPALLPCQLSPSSLLPRVWPFPWCLVSFSNPTHWITVTLRVVSPRLGSISTCWLLFNIIHEATCGETPSG